MNNWTERERTMAVIIALLTLALIVAIVMIGDPNFSQP